MDEILHGTKNLLFDLGGVIIDLKRERAVEAFIEIGCPGIAELLDNSHQQGAFLALEEGRMSAAEFRDEVRRMAGREISDSAIDCALNRFLVGIPVKKLRMLRVLRKHYRVMMLSNTNPIMFDTEIARLFRAEGGEMGDYFDDVFTSYRLGITKPARRCFEAVIEQSGIVPEETLFLDDSQTNLDAAAALGFRTYLAKPYEDYSPMFGLEL